VYVYLLLFGRSAWEFWITFVLWSERWQSVMPVWRARMLLSIISRLGLLHSYIRISSICIRAWKPLDRVFVQVCCVHYYWLWAVQLSSSFDSLCFVLIDYLINRSTGCAVDLFKNTLWFYHCLRLSLTPVFMSS